MTDDHQSEPVAAPDPHFFRWEQDSSGDFPFYAGQPVALTGLQWRIVVLGVLLGFMALVAPVPFYRTTAGGFLAAILFFAIPLGVLAGVTGSGWKAIFRTLRLRDLGWMIGVALANLVVTVIVALVLRQVFDMNANPVSGILAGASGQERVLFYVRSLFQLFGEEVVSVLPFLAAMWFCHARLGLSRKRCLVVAWIAAALIFGALHLPTYGWNFVQCFIVIGTARIVLLLGYLVTKNIWVSTGAHIINDWLIFTMLMVMMDMGVAA